MADYGGPYLEWCDEHDIGWVEGSYARCPLCVKEEQEQALPFTEPIGKPVTRAEALQIATNILERAERERREYAVWEASRGIQWEHEPEGWI